MRGDVCGCVRELTACGRDTDNARHTNLIIVTKENRTMRHRGWRKRARERYRDDMRQQ